MQPWMKTTALLLIGALLGVAVTSLAFYHFCRPHHPPGAGDTERILSNLSSKLALTADQKDKVAVLLKEELPKTDALRADTDQKFKTLRESFHAKLLPLLNADQQKKFNDMVAQRQKHDAMMDHSFGCSGPASQAVSGK